MEALLDSDEEHKGLSPVTWEQAYRAPLGTFFTAAMRDYGDDGFPNLTVDGIHYLGTRKAEEGKQRALSADELKILFEGVEFQAIAADPTRESLYWLSVVAHFTGARPRELCQINPQVDFVSTPIEY